MAHDYKHVNMPNVDQGILVSGLRKIAKRMLVTADTVAAANPTGATTVGRGQWLNVESMTWKTFMLYRGNQSAGDIVSAQVDIEAALELDVADPDGMTKVVILGTLDAASRAFSIEAPWAFIRARLKTAEAANAEIHVGLYGLGA